MEVTSSPVTPGDVAATRWGRPVRAEQLQTWARQLAHLTGYTMRRAVHHACDYADVSASPLGVDQVVRTIVTISPRTLALWVGVRYQAAAASSPDYSIAAVLKDLSGVVVDEGILWGSDRLLGADVALGAPIYPARFVHSGFRFDASAGSSQTSPRLLNCPGKVGETLEVVMTTSDTRIIDVCLWELAEVDMPLSGS